VLAAALARGATAPVLAHHGFGLFQMQGFKDYSGTLTKLELVNPHSYLYFRARNPAPSRPQYTARGQEAATAFRMWSVGPRTGHRLVTASPATRLVRVDLRSS
jgi:hypothetical protein